MPRLNNGEMVSMNTGGVFNYSAVKLEKLGATDYTLVTIVTDISLSVSKYKSELEKCLVEIVKACRKSPRADNLMIRLLTFNEKGEEVHGYKLLDDCNPDDYLDILDTRGNTALYDASYDAIIATTSYAKVLNEQDFDTNGIIFVITDGDDNSSTFNQNSVKDAFEAALKDEYSLISVLIGVNLDSETEQYLENYKNDANFTQYIDIGNADDKSLAKLADFVSKSISSQSQSLADGVPSNQGSLTI